MRRTNFNGASKAITTDALQVLQFSGNDLPSRGVVAFHFRSHGTDSTLADLCTRFRVKADSLIIADVDITHYRKLCERFWQSNTPNETTGQVLTISFNLPDIVDDDLADVCQFPEGTTPTVEITTTATVGGATAASIVAGWTQTDQRAQFYPRIIGTPMNIAASQRNARFPISEPGMLRGLVVPTAGIDEFVARINGADVHRLPGLRFGGTAADGGDMLLASQNGEGVDTITSHAALRLPMVPAASGVSEIVLTTAATWPGVTAELTTWAIYPQGG